MTELHIHTIHGYDDIGIHIVVSNESLDTNNDLTFTLYQSEGIEEEKVVTTFDLDKEEIKELASFLLSKIK